MTIEKTAQLSNVHQMPQVTPELMEKVLVEGNMAALSAKERLSYISTVCKTLGLNPLTRPFEYINFQGKLSLYARKDATEQLRNVYKISTENLEIAKLDDIYTVTAHMRTPDGRYDCSTGAVYIKGLIGDALANAFMKAETKAKRRCTLSICGLNILDESEIDSIEGKKVIYDTEKENEITTLIENSTTMEELKLAYNEANELYKKVNDCEMKKRFTALVQQKKSDLEKSSDSEGVNIHKKIEI